MISVIIPVYNVEKYIKRCVDSLLNQTYKNIEIILVNDGSTDNTLRVINENYSSVKNVFLFNQKNSGPAIARNNGINYSNGKYIMFVDSDDYVDNDYVECYYNAIVDNNYDLVIGGYKKIKGDKIDFIRKLSKGEFSKYIVMGPVCKLYTKEFLVNNNITFLDTTASEDIYFNALAYSKNPKIKIIDNVGYYYCYNEISVSNTLHKGFNQSVDIIGLVTAINYKNIKNVTLNQYFIIRYLIWYLLYSGKNSNSKEFNFEYLKLFSWLRENIPDYKKNKYIYNRPHGEFLKIHLCIYIFIILIRLNLVDLFARLYCKGKIKKTKI